MSDVEPTFPLETHPCPTCGYRTPLEWDCAVCTEAKAEKEKS